MSEWKEHDGGPQPDETKGRLVEIELREGGNFKDKADIVNWPWMSDLLPCSNILRYRLLGTHSSDEGMARGIPEPLDEHVKTLRDEFAMAALVSIRFGANAYDHALFAYEVADAMLAAREKK